MVLVELQKQIDVKPNGYKNNHIETLGFIIEDLFTTGHFSLDRLTDLEWEGVTNWFRSVYVDRVGEQLKKGRQYVHLTIVRSNGNANSKGQQAISELRTSLTTRRDENTRLYNELQDRRTNNPKVTDGYLLAEEAFQTYCRLAAAHLINYGYLNGEDLDYRLYYKTVLDVSRLEELRKKARARSQDSKVSTYTNSPQKLIGAEPAIHSSRHNYPLVEAASWHNGRKELPDIPPNGKLLKLPRVFNTGQLRLSRNGTGNQNAVDRRAPKVSNVQVYISDQQRTLSNGEASNSKCSKAQIQDHTPYDPVRERLNDELDIFFRGNGLIENIIEAALDFISRRR